jgi:hypothetical protein
MKVEVLRVLLECIYLQGWLRTSISRLVCKTRFSALLSLYSIELLLYNANKLQEAQRSILIKPVPINGESTIGRVRGGL